MMNLEKGVQAIEDELGLHNRIEIHYYVDHYEVHLVDEASDNIIMKSEGSTVEEAITNFNTDI